MTDFQKQRLADNEEDYKSKFNVVWGLCLNLTTHEYQSEKASEYLRFIADNATDNTIEKVGHKNGTAFTTSDNRNYFIGGSGTLQDGYFQFLTDEYKSYESERNSKSAEIMQACAEVQKKKDEEKQAEKERLRKLEEQEQEENTLPQLCCVADVEKKEVQFLIEPYIIKNNITAIVGDGGVGKTFVWVDIASAITNNKLPAVMGIPFETKTPNTDNNKVLYFTSEDNTAETLKDRFEKAGANLHNLQFVPLEDKAFHRIMLDSDELEELIKIAKPALCVLDPLQSFVRGKMADRNNMRRQLDCLTRLAKVYSVSFLIIVHTNKSTSTDARTKLSDSSDIWDKCRSVLFVGKTSKNEIRYLSQEKGNYTSENNRLDTQLFAIQDGQIDHRGTTDKKYYDFATEVIFRKDTTVKDTAKDFILNTLKEKELLVSELKESASAYGISDKTLERAKAELKKDNKVKYRKETAGKNKGVQWYISLNPIP